MVIMCASYGTRPTDFALVAVTAHRVHCQNATECHDAQMFAISGDSEAHQSATVSMLIVTPS